MRKITLLCMAIAVIALTFVSCESVQEAERSSVIKRSLLEVNTETRIKGTYEEPAYLLDYEVLLQDEVYHLTADINGKKLEAHVSYEDYTIAFNGHSNTLEAEEMLILNRASVALADAIADGRDDQNGHCGVGSTAQTQQTGPTEISFTEGENTVVRILDYWSQAPANYVYGERLVEDKIEPTQRRGNDGVSCIKKGRRYSLQYDGSRGNTNVTRTANYNGGGSYGCMGRCGGGCGRWWIPSSWTLDCFEHDECSLRYGASGGSSDSNCGDEFNEAADDWTFGVIRGCRG